MQGISVIGCVKARQQLWLLSDGVDTALPWRLRELYHLCVAFSHLRARVCADDVIKHARRQLSCQGQMDGRRLVPGEKKKHQKAYAYTVQRYMLFFYLYLLYVFIHL